MKAYRKPIIFKGTTTTQVPILPDMNMTDDPQQGRVTYLVYAPTGDYLGFSDDEQVRKYLYGKLYYKTKGAYSTHNTKVDNFDKTQRKIFVYLKTTRAIALYLHRRIITELDLIDTADKSSHAAYTLQKVKDTSFNFNNISNFSDQFNQCEAIKKKLVDDANALANRQREERARFETDAKMEVIKYLEGLAAAEKDLQDQGAEVGIPTDF